jgi:hypothetical protein
MPVLGDYLVLSWNDLGMHCMNHYHHNFSVLPPFNNLYAQVIKRGDAGHAPQVVTQGVTLEYSFPGNTTSVTKTDFWTYAPQIFGVTLPPDVGLTGKGLSGVLDLVGTHFVAPGVPLTPFPDAQPTVEDAYQQALVIARDGVGVELARSTPVVPVSVDMACVSAGCHSSEADILGRHERVAGFDPAATPILCAGCHADPALGTAGIPEADYFSRRMHENHNFLDQQLSGTAECYKCHPGSSARCLRGVMATTYGLVCQDCHGNMTQMATSILNGRIPWANEPACGGCHDARFAEPAGQLYRQSTGHGGVYCEGCHNSTHAEWTSGVARDNANVLALQGQVGVLKNCVVCHGVTPASTPGPHGIVVTDVAEQHILGGAGRLTIFPNPASAGCAIRVAGQSAEGGRLLVFDAHGRTVRLLRARQEQPGWLDAAWDARDGTGRRVEPGVYFVLWSQGERRAAGKVLIVE